MSHNNYSERDRGGFLYFQSATGTGFQCERLQFWKLNRGLTSNVSGGGRLSLNPPALSLLSKNYQWKVRGCQQVRSKRAKIPEMRLLIPQKMI
ncbi:hypothetical protein [Kamptonema formosum]|uniref:hypothetical protein n=1 Tax=Kamptonema formosum TaxID=331992 RepID=UPI000475685D|nr:hypothetical protein [Oscillatoria sp. PCC 10802]